MTAGQTPSPITVLVVDDDAANRNLVTTLLRLVGHESVEAANGSQALDLARRHRPDLIITDILMPEMDGYELIREVRADASIAATPAIFYTANYHNAEAAPIASSLGVRDVLVKPIDPGTLLSAVEDARTRGHIDVPVIAPNFHERHRQVLNSKLLDTVRDLEVSESALLTSEERFRVLAEHAPIGIFSITAQGDLTYTNPVFEQIVTGTAAGRPLLEFVHVADARWFGERLAKAIASWESVDEQVRLSGDERSERWVRLCLSPLADANAGVILVGTAEDITAEMEARRAREELNQRLQIADRLESLGQLAAGIAHDFNNVLSLVISYNEFVIAGLGDAGSATSTDQIAEAIDHAATDARAVQQAAERAVALTRRLLLFASRTAEPPERIDVCAVLDSSIGLLTGPTRGTSRIQWNLAPSPLVVLADRTQIEQIVMNLVVNARDAQRGAPDARITISCHEAEVADNTVDDLPAGRYACITVEDNGAGIPPEAVPRIFEPFFTTKPAGQGTGLGLSTVHRIVSAFDGAITVQSVIGRGTTFQVYLPIAS